MQQVPHEYGPSNVGHGEGQCKWCLGTNRENAIIAPNHCEERAKKGPAYSKNVDERTESKIRAEEEICLYVAQALYRNAVGDPYYDFIKDPQGWAKHRFMGDAQMAIAAYREITND